MSLQDIEKFLIGFLFLEPHSGVTNNGLFLRFLLLVGFVKSYASCGEIASCESSVAAEKCAAIGVPLLF